MWMIAGLVLATIVGFVLWAAYFVVALLIDEDLNHWDWPGDNGPGFAANLRMVVVSGIAAVLSVGVPTALILWLW